MQFDIPRVQELDSSNTCYDRIIAGFDDKGYYTDAIRHYIASEDGDYYVAVEEHVVERSKMIEGKYHFHTEVTCHLTCRKRDRLAEKHFGKKMTVWVGYNG